MSQQIIRDLESNFMKAEVPQFDVGDIVGVHVRIIEGGKERIQVFTGTVLAVGGRGINRKFTVRRIVAGEGVERIFPIHSPRIVKVEVVRSGVIHRSKLYFLRDRIGKATRLKERRVKRRKDLKVEGEESIAEKRAREAEEEAKIKAAEEAKAAEKAAKDKAAEEAKAAEKATRDKAAAEKARTEEAPAEEAKADEAPTEVVKEEEGDKKE
jgi:large subunit ribosomal protein L19